jgi:uncharacterized protein (TIGR03067 family)
VILAFLLGIAGIWAGATLLALHILGPPAVRDLTDPELAAVAEKQGVRVVTADGSIAARSGFDTVRAEPATEADLADYATLFAEEFGLLPPELVKRAGLWRVVLCTQLTLNRQPVAGVPDFDRGTLYLEVGAVRICPADARRGVHHEFFHLLDYRLNRRVDVDPTWTALNRPGFRYGKGGLAALNDPDLDTAPSDRDPGFLSRYSTTAVEEDKAEVFSFMAVHARFVDARGRADPVIRAKADRMRAILAAACPAADDAFWDRLRLAERTDFDLPPEVRPHLRPARPAPARPRPAVLAKGQGSIVGRWRLVSTNGEPVPSSEATIETFNADGSWAMVNRIRDREIEDKARYAVRPKADQSEIDFLCGPPAAKPTLKGIYTVAGDQLTIAVRTDGGERPKEFTALRHAVSTLAYERVPGAD